MDRTVAWVIVVVASVTLTNCGQVPTEELEQAEMAIAEARASEATNYAPDALFEAEAALDAAKKGIDTQGQRFLIGRSYEEPIRLLADAKSAAEHARDVALAGREQARLDAQDALVDAEMALSEAEAAIENGSLVKKTPADIVAIRTELKEAASSLEAANVDFEAGKYAAARAHAEAIRARTMIIVADLMEAKKKAT
ncbi:MAG TPA: hypothetical protein VLK65_17620 [Vicinamibacteria bacterium]|nr:hypothetical protein [Vicinamibacteria bacterium]